MPTCWPGYTTAPATSPYGLIDGNKVIAMRDGARWEATFSVSTNLLTLTSARFLDGPRAGQAQAVTGSCDLRRAAG